MDVRKEELLTKLIDQHVQTAAPVSSGLLVDAYHLDVSSATVRNDMAVLEEEGYIYQPHTSAGRVPTEKGYLFYLQSLKSKTLPVKVEKDLQELVSSQPRVPMKLVARYVADYTQEAVIIARGINDTYYTGISHLFSKPEMRDYEVVRSISAVVDHFDTVLEDVFEKLSDETKIFVGSENPFSDLCYMMGFSFESEGEEGAIILLGPMRMDYARNMSVMNAVREMVDHLDEKTYK